MISNGWAICADNLKDTVYKSSCEPPMTFWGYNYGQEYGGCVARFMGSGKAILDFGNCWKSGQTRVYLNKKRLKMAGKLVNSTVVTFNYKKGDVLRLEETPTGIVKINALHLSNCVGNILIAYGL